MTTGPGHTRPRRILAVCKGGHCRAPMAAAVLAHQGGGTVQTRAAAIRDWHLGEAAHPAMVAAAARAGYDLTGHQGVQVSPELLEWADVVLAMDAAVLDALRALADEATSPKLALYLGDRDVPDPWQQSDEAFTACVRVIESAAGHHLVSVQPGQPGPIAFAGPGPHPGEAVTQAGSIGSMPARDAGKVSLWSFPEGKGRNLASWSY